MIRVDPKTFASIERVLETQGIKPKGGVMGRIARRVKCVETGEEFPDKAAAAKAAGVAPGSMGGALAPGGTGKVNGRTYRWIQGQAASEPVPKKQHQKKTRGRFSRVATGEPVNGTAGAGAIVRSKPSDVLRQADGDARVNLARALASIAGMAAGVGDLKLRNIRLQVAGVDLSIEELSIARSA